MDVRDNNVLIKKDIENDFSFKQHLYIAYLPVLLQNKVSVMPN